MVGVQWLGTDFHSFNGSSTHDGRDTVRDTNRSILRSIRYSIFRSHGNLLEDCRITHSVGFIGRVHSARA